MILKPYKKIEIPEFCADNSPDFHQRTCKEFRKIPEQSEINSVGILSFRNSVDNLVTDFCMDLF